MVWWGAGVGTRSWKRCCSAIFPEGGGGGPGEEEEEGPGRRRRRRTTTKTKECDGAPKRGSQDWIKLADYIR